ncbi:uncharacterized protein EI90DRAFT_3065214 [Cantharellus anzutake]|uniref:uncharacterized protein n=1 Tax=Cantharellus anzutake TaxID=1750568 RepID=UPI001905E44F|nr:uncharacterized protein EI90DRAFT_3065214 [Cantharellus anzutake]KAF8328421.1 hypothetical protein EI90DRAFT_3065214 [Cantharellus anzutake]
MLNVFLLTFIHMFIVHFACCDHRKAWVPGGGQSKRKPLEHNEKTCTQRNCGHAGHKPSGPVFDQNNVPDYSNRS